MPAIGLDLDGFITGQIDITKNISQGIDLFHTDMIIEEHLVDEVFLLDLVHIPKGELGETVTGQQLGDGRTDRTAANNVNGGGDLGGVENLAALI